MYYLEDQWAIGGLDVAGQWDVNLEEIWHVVSKGWYAVYPDEFGDEWEQEGFTSKLMEAMDVARGGKFLSPPEQYPDIAQADSETSPLAQHPSLP